MRWRDGDLLWLAYAFEQGTRLRRVPVLVEAGLLAVGPLAKETQGVTRMKGIKAG